ncbi:MAG: hypothetical protein RL660_1167 [Bacteroidota bacterium]|jgi:hypothetical protein
MKKHFILLAFFTFLCNTTAFSQLPGNSVRILADYNYVTIPDPSSNLLNNTMTIEAWLYYECANGTTSNMIFSKGWCSGPDYTFYFNVINQKLRFKKIRNGTGGCSNTNDPIWETTAECIPFNTWTHIALTIDATTSSTVLNFYVDGVHYPHTMLQGVDGAGYNASPHPLLIGASRNITNSYTTINGNIDDVRIWHTIRTQAEIIASKDTELVGNEVGLHAYWKLNETGSGGGISVVNSASTTGATFNGSTVGTAANLIFTDNSTLPNKLPTCNPILWLKADQGVSSNASNEVHLWSDQSGLNNHANMSNASFKPVVKSNEINNKPIVRFDGVDDYMSTAAINLSTVQKAEVFYVAKSRGEGFVLMHHNDPSAANAFSICENYSNGTNGHSAILNGNTSAFATSKSQATDSCYHRMNVRFDKSLTGLDQVKIYRNSVLLANTNGAVNGAEMTNNLGNYSMLVGGTNLTSYQNAPVDIAEIIVYNKILTAYERNTVNAYLNSKYFTNKVSTQFTTIPSSNLYSNAICDDDVWRHSYNSTQPSELIASIKSSCLTFDERADTAFVETTAIPYAGSYFMRRHYVISPTYEIAGNKTVRLYYTAADFANLQAVLPSLTSHTQLSVIQYDGLNEDGIYDPSGGSITFIPPSSITNGMAYGQYYLEFTVDHFSEFWIQAASSPLQLESLYLNVTTDQTQHLLQWQCSGCENITRFNVLQSDDLSSFKLLNTIQATEQTENYVQKAVPGMLAQQYFKVEAISSDGSIYASNICVAKNDNFLYQLQVLQMANSVTVRTNASNAKVEIYNMQGQLVLQGSPSVVLPKHAFAAGLYIAQFVDATGIARRQLKFAIY